jgi:FkbM family methyltransferase
MNVIRNYSTDNKLSVFHHLFLASIGFAGYFLKFIQFRGFYTYSKIISHLLPSNQNMISISLFNKRCISFDIRDYYWLRLLSSYFDYETEIKEYISNLSLKSFTFVDLGANIGYWSLYCSQIPSCNRILAVEPHPSIFAKLKLNLANLNLPINLLNYALSSSDKEFIRFNSPINFDNLVGSSISYDEKSSSVDSVKNLHHKEFVSEYLLPFASENIVIKIDIEGEELNFVSNLDSSLQKVFVIYEDHGKDTLHRTSELLFSNNWVVYHCTKLGLIKLDTIDDVKKIKKRVDVGYNFLACRTLI